MGKRIVKSLYGNVALYKGYCQNCKKYAFVIDGFLQCCDELYTAPDKEKIKRESEGEYRRSRIPMKLKREVVSSQDNRCVYCNSNLDGYVWSETKKRYIKLRVNFDHFVPWHFDQDNHETNIVASCHICNGIKSDKHFTDVNSARDFIVSEREKRKDL